MCRYSAHAGVSCAVWTRHQLAAAAAVVQLTAAASHSSPHTTPPAGPRPELWASTCLAQSVLSGEKSEVSPHVSAVFTGGWWWWWCTPSRAHHATDTGRGPARPGRRGPVAAARLRRAPPSGPAPAAASACGLRAPALVLPLATLPSVAQLRRHSVSINPWRL